MKKIITIVSLMILLYSLTVPVVSNHGIQFNFPDGSGYWLEF